MSVRMPTIAMGIGVWAMHFIGMLAFTLPVVVGYDILITLVSMLPAILASALVLHLIGRERLGASRLLTGGALMGGGIGTMLQKHLNSFYIVPGGRIVKRRITVMTILLDIGAVRQQELDDAEPVLPACR